MKREFYVVIEKDGEGGFVGETPQLRDCSGRGQTLDELIVNMRAVIETRLKNDDLHNQSEFIGVYKIEI